MEFKNIEKLPTPPGVAVKLLELFAAPDVCLDDLNQVICADATLTARIIKYANSPVYARRHNASSLNQAIMMLGANGVKIIALTFSLTDAKSTDASNTFDFDRFWAASLATAVCAKKIYGQSGHNPDSGFLTGMMLNVGQLALYCNAPEQYNQAMEGKSVYDLRLLDIERDEFQENRYALGVEVLKAWHFPESTLEALTRYSDSSNEATFDHQAITLANKMAYAILSESPDFQFIESITADLAVLLGTSVDETEDFFDLAMQEYSEIASILSYECPEHKSLKEIELEAKVKMLEMSMDLHVTNAQVTAENDELKGIAYVDQLTNLGNRRNYDSTAQSELDRCLRLERLFGMLVIDIDHFKRVNDSLGHAAGDEILKAVAEKLQSSLRSYDRVFRFGGEEFVVILPEVEVGLSKKIAERLRNAIENHAVAYAGEELSVTISIGGYVCHPEKPISLEEIFQQADEALYQAKRTGRNRCFVVGESDSEAPIVPPTGSPATLNSQPMPTQP